MTIRLIVLTASALLVASCDRGHDNGAAAAPNAASSTTSAADEEAIRQQVARWLQLVKSKDAAAIAQLYTEDGSVMPANAPIGKGRAAIQQVWAGMLGTPGFDLVFTPDQIVVANSGDLALDRGTYTLKMAPAGKAMTDTGKYVVVWRKVDGEWKAIADIFNSDLPAAAG